ncbi:acyltransferase [Aneurinibacillus terranovensis]|uniref:acyltransferase n=1 Tax=Aneurinibacillus terranovensis TaxID=278991 RepID=UPI000427C602|nr:acyltransferase [Aneurinibacillus terranovensis]
MTSNQVSSGWNMEIDYLRAFAIAAVIVIHVSAYFTSIKTINSIVVVSMFLDVLAHYAVPLFIFISGFALALKYKKIESIGKFYGKRAKSILPQYLCFTIVYTLFFNEPNAPGVILRKIVHNFMWAGAAYHLWFYAIIVQIYALFPLVLAVYNYVEKRWKSEWLVLLALLIQTVWNVYYIVSPTFISIALSQIFYLVFGMYICRTYTSISTWIHSVKLSNYTATAGIFLVTAAISAFWMSGLLKYKLFYSIKPSYFIGPAILEPALYLFIFVLCFRMAHTLAKWKNPFTAIIQKIGRFSFGIYLVHVLVLKLLISGFAVVNLKPAHLLFYPLLYLGTLAFSFLLVYLISLLPYSQFIVGIHSRRKTKENAETTAA